MSEVMLDKTFDPKAVEPRLYKTWEESGAFQPSDRDGAESFSIVIPPPNVTGSLHIGHALNNTLQDVLIRFERMRGKKALWIPGTDHAGIATQMVVERQLAQANLPGRRDMGREAFVAKIWEWKAESGGTIVQQLRRLGASCDWSRERFTLDEGLSDAVKTVFVTLHKQGLIYRDKRLVNWDPHFQTAISDLEVEQRDVDGAYYHLAYPLADGVTYEHPVAFDDEGKPTEFETRNFIVVATTRPETMLADAAVAVHPEDARYQGLIGKFVDLPIVGRRIPIVADDYADKDKGSGAVKITPAHDFNDFQVGKRHGLPLMNILDERAHLNDTVPERFRGLFTMKARKQIIAEFEELGLLREIEKTKHAVPHGDRSGVVIEPLLTDQWYVNAGELAKEALAAVEDGRTVFEPKNWEKTYFEWLKNIEPWCVSRQLWWGHRIPAWYGPDGHVFVESDEAAALAAAEAHYGKAVELRQDEDVLDTWFSSALWPFSTLGWPEKTADLETFYPTHTLITGFDIIFFWVARMMMMGLHFTKQVPFKRVIINALVLDEKGQKMSKSKGNVIDPLKLVDAFGADALRFTLTSMSGQARAIRMSEKRVEGYRNFGTKLWNATRFAQMNECALAANFDVTSVQGTLARWIRGETAKTLNELTRALEEASFDQAAGTLYRFVWNIVCDWYLELAKPILNGEDAAAKAEIRATTAWVLDQCYKMLHPVMPFITEELWDKTAGAAGRAKMLINETWPELSLSLVDASAEAEIDWVINLVTEIRSVRAEMNVPAGAKTPLVIVGANDETKSRLTRHADLITTLARLSEVTLGYQAPAGSAPIAFGEATAALSIAEFIDVAAERARLAKDIAAQQSDLEKTLKKLENPDFIARAKPEVIEENRERKETAESTIAKLSAALDRLSQMG